MRIYDELFKDWQLETWANILEVVGFVAAVGGFILSLFIKSEITKLKTRYIFDKRISKHITNLKDEASSLNTLLDDYNNNREQIRIVLSECRAEIDDLIPKLGFWQGRKCKSLSKFLRKRRKTTFVVKQYVNYPIWIFIRRPFERWYQTSYEDVFVIYERLIEIIRQMENIKHNNSKTV